jgi:hypothetical protein
MKLFQIPNKSNYQSITNLFIFSHLIHITINQFSLNHSSKKTYNLVKIPSKETFLPNFLPLSALLFNTSLCFFKALGSNGTYSLEGLSCSLFGIMSTQTGFGTVGVQDLNSTQLFTFSVGLTLYFLTSARKFRSLLNPFVFISLLFSTKVHTYAIIVTK